MEGIEEGSECRVDDSLVVETIDNIVQDTDKVPEMLVKSVTNDTWSTEWREQTLEQFCVFDALRVVKNENSWFQVSVGLFGEFNDSIAGAGSSSMHSSKASKMITINLVHPAEQELVGNP